jgi:hypothetical protein
MRQRVEVEVGDERMDGHFRIESRIALIFVVHLFAYLVADACEWRQDHATFDESDYRSIECDLRVGFGSRQVASGKLVVRSCRTEGRVRCNCAPEPGDVS